MKKIIYFLATLIIVSLATKSFSDVLGDINSDGKINLAEAIYALQVVAGIKPETTYDNSTLSGSWIMIAETTGEHDLYMLFDGNGNITDWGALGPVSGTYSVLENGAITISLSISNGEISAIGQLTSATAGSLRFGNDPNTIVFNLFKVNDLSALQGSWSGALTEDATPNNSYNISFSVDSNGEITSLTGFASPVLGKLYYESGKLAGHIYTAEPETNVYNQIQINGVLSNGVTINGTYGVDNEKAFDGTLTLTKAVQISTVMSAGQEWMDRDLGASRVATSSTDAEAYGDLYQWGRGSDGHEKHTSPTTPDLSSSDTPGDGSFITVQNSPFDWRDPQKDTLWQGVSGTNNPCPAGFRLPTNTELDTERISWSLNNNSAGAFASPLKLVVAGYRGLSIGAPGNAGSRGYYWSSTVDGIVARYLDFDSSNAGMDNTYHRANGFSVRCLKD